MLITILTLAGVHLLASMTPGPDFLLVSTTAAQYNRKSALAAASGITAGVAVWALFALTGLTFILHKMHALQQIIQIMGGAYLCWIGVQMVRQKAMSHGEEQRSATNDNLNPGRLFLRGLFTNLANPKVFIYFSSVFSLFVSDEFSSLIRWSLLFILVMISFLWFCAVVLFFSHPAIKVRFQQFSHSINRCAGIIFIVFGLHLMFRKI